MYFRGVTSWLTECSAVHSSQLGLGLAPSGEGSVLGDVLHVHSVVLQSARLLHLGVLLPGPLAEAPVLADEDLLTSRELELGAPESLDSLVLNKQIMLIENSTVIPTSSLHTLNLS